jgi:hypothetical protein
MAGACCGMALLSIDMRPIFFAPKFFNHLSARKRDGDGSIPEKKKWRVWEAFLKGYSNETGFFSRTTQTTLWPCRLTVKNHLPIRPQWSYDKIRILQYDTVQPHGWAIHNCWAALPHGFVQHRILMHSSKFMFCVKRPWRKERLSFSRLDLGIGPGVLVIN